MADKAFYFGLVFPRYFGRESYEKACIPRRCSCMELYAGWHKKAAYEEAPVISTDQLYIFGFLVSDIFIIILFKLK